jgi:hypothetical protein
MGYQVYEVKGNRFGGYGVPSICDHPDCDEEIDRGMSYCCGNDPRSEYGCHQYFCPKHLQTIKVDEDQYVDVCERCAAGKEPFPIKPDTKEWTNHLMTDNSWCEWRKNNPTLPPPPTNNE